MIIAEIFSIPFAHLLPYYRCHTTSRMHWSIHRRAFSILVSFCLLSLLSLLSVHHLHEHHHAQAHSQAHTRFNGSARAIHLPHAGPAHARQLPGQTLPQPLPQPFPQPPTQPPPKPQPKPPPKTSDFVVIPTIAHQTNWYVVTGNEIDNKRRENVDKLLTTFPWIQRMQGNDGFDEACVALLRLERIRVSPSYYDGSGEIHAGKIGHWCSFLTFLQRIGSQGVGVWIEDDIVLQSLTDVDAIQDAVSQASNAKPLQRFSHADGLLVVRNDPQLWQPLRESGITNPTDILYTNLGLYDVKHKAMISKLTNIESTITSTSLLHIRDVNSRLDGKASTTH